MRPRLGPLPRGDYDILNRMQGGNPNLDGVPAWALDRKDGVPWDDIAQGYGRGAFRFHFGRSEGCVTTNDRNGFNTAVTILNNTATQSITDASGQHRTYYGDFHVFSGLALHQPYSHEGPFTDTSFPIVVWGCGQVRITRHAERPIGFRQWIRNRIQGYPLRHQGISG